MLLLAFVFRHQWEPCFMARKSQLDITLEFKGSRQTVDISAMERPSPFRVAALWAPIGQAVSAMRFKVQRAPDIAGSKVRPAFARTAISRTPCAKCLQLQEEAEYTYQALWTSEHSQSQFDMNVCRDRWLMAKQAQREHRLVCDANIGLEPFDPDEKEAVLREIGAAQNKKG
jgi:hypothetical protein